MSEELFVPSSFDGTARLFPLPNVVLFPRVTLPLHIFEPRYRQMTADALAGDQLVTMVLLKPGWESQYEGKPPVHETCCLGKIVADQHLEDGRYNLLLRGINRARILHEPACDKPYRSARVELLQDIDMTTADLARKLRRSLADLARAWFAAMGIDFDQVSKLFSENHPLGTVGDVLAFVLPLPPDIKQDLLQQLNVQERINRLAEYLEKNPPPERTASRKFPPEFSVN